jgi:DNA-binding NtrC family response regulator
VVDENRLAGRGHILIVDDDEAIANALRGELVQRGLSVDLAAEPVLAERMLRSHRYSVVVVDAYMTGQLHERAMSFVDTVLALRSGAQLVLVSAYGSTALVDHILAAGGTTVVRKPASIRMLAELVDGFAPGDRVASA